MSVSDLFWQASLEDLKKGYTEQDDHYVCLLCGKEAEKGIIYPQDELFLEAERYMRSHIERVHGSVFEYLSGLDKKLTGLSEHQIRLLRLFYQGKSDAQVQKELGIGSASTIRNHRFALKEKERQAKVFLTMMELLKETDKRLSKTLSAAAPKTERSDDPFFVTPEEYQEIVMKCFPEGVSGPLHKFPRKQKQKLVVLQELAKHFEAGRIYSEKEVNQILEQVYEDHVTIRRYLIDYGLLDRKPDGSKYWRKQKEEKGAEEPMNRKQELKQMYKEMKTEAGVFQIRNTKNGKVFVDSTMNLKTLNGHKFALKHGSHINKTLQQDWNQWGEDAFAFEVLEVLAKKDDPFFDAKGALEKLESKWLEKLQPYGERGYHREK